MEIKLSLSKKEILQRVKAKTHIKGVADLAANAAKTTEAVRYSYNEQAGDDPNSDFLLLSSLRASVDKFKTVVADYITTFNDYEVSADNISDTLSATTTDTFTINLIVSDRFNKALTQPLADQASAYVENTMIYEWFLPINPEMAKNYAAAAADNEVHIQRCFIKVRPATPTYKYPATITLTLPVVSSEAQADPESYLESGVRIPIGQEEEISYTLTAEDTAFTPIDDIIVTTSDACCKCGINRGKWMVKGLSTGTAIVSLFSRHDDTVKVRFPVRIV